MATKTTKTKNKDRLATEERLLLAAEQIFSKHGFKGATTRMIAKKADVNVALIARYFDGKFGLMIKLVEKKATSSRYTELTYPPQETLTEECTTFLMERLRFYIEDLNIFRVVLIQFLTDPKFLKRFHESLNIFEKHPQFEERVQRLIDAKKVSSHVTPFQVLDTIECHLFGLVIDRVLIHNENRELIEEKLQHFIKNYCSSLELKK